MTKLNEMWAALTAYQPQADAAGHGISWAKMCKEKTYADDAAAAADDAAAAADDAAAADAADAAVYAAYAVYDDAAAAAYAADAAAYAADAHADAEKWAQRALDSINKVLIKPAPVQPAYKDNTPHLSVGESSFESWYDQYLASAPVHQETKQRLRDAYAAGMGDPLVMATPAQQEPVYVQTRHKEEHGFSDWGSLLDPTHRNSKWAEGVEMRLLYTFPPQRKPLPKDTWPTKPSSYVNDEYRGYSKSDLDDYAMQVLNAHGIKE